MTIIQGELFTAVKPNQQKNENNADPIFWRENIHSTSMKSPITYIDIENQ